MINSRIMRMFIFSYYIYIYIFYFVSEVLCICTDDCGVFSLKNILFFYCNIFIFLLFWVRVKFEIFLIWKSNRNLIKLIGLSCFYLLFSIFICFKNLTSHILIPLWVCYFFHYFLYSLFFLPNVPFFMWLICSFFIADHVYLFMQLCQFKRKVLFCLS
jgi:hypothetical protein